MKSIGSENVRVSVLVGLLLAAATVLATVTVGPVRPREAVASHTTWCPSPADRASAAVDDPPPLAPPAIDPESDGPEPPLDFGARAGESTIPARGADVTPISGAALLDAANLAREVNRIVGQLNPAVEVRSVSLSWRCGSQDATCVVAWERKGGPK